MSMNGLAWTSCDDDDDEEVDCSVLETVLDYDRPRNSRIAEHQYPLCSVIGTN